jgi:hypothetical protein
VKGATKLQRHEIFQPDTVSLKRITIMDIDREALQEPIDILVEERDNRNTFYSPRRWFDLHVKVLCGSLISNFKNRVGEIDVAVATEV